MGDQDLRLGDRVWAGVWRQLCNSGEEGQHAAAKSLIDGPDQGFKARSFAVTSVSAWIPITVLKPHTQQQWPGVSRGPVVLAASQTAALCRCWTSRWPVQFPGTVSAQQAQLAALALTPGSFSSPSSPSCSCHTFYLFELRIVLLSVYF